MTGRIGNFAWVFFYEPFYTAYYFTLWSVDKSRMRYKVGIRHGSAMFWRFKFIW